MELSRLRRGELLASIGGIVLLISLWLSWYSFSASVNVPGIGNFGGGSASYNAWDLMDFIPIVLLIVALVAIGLGVLTAAGRSVALPVAASAITGGAGILAVLLIVFRILSKPDGGVGSFNLGGTDLGLDLAYGIFVALVAALLVAVGGWMSMQEEGTSFKDAGKQASQAAGQFSSGQQQQQPPPPPANQPPPPPPPPPSGPPPPGPPPSDPPAA